MPELPEVETTRLGILPHVQGQTVAKVIIRQATLRWPIPPTLATDLPQQMVNSLSRRGKYILLETKAGTAIFHLGMSGTLRILPADYPQKKHDHVDIVFTNQQCLRLNDPRRFGALLWAENNPLTHPLLKNLGAEPLTDEFTDEYLWQRSRNKKTAMKQFLMDGRMVVGIGNIYANEALYAAKVNPRRPAGKLTLKECKLLAKHIKKILAKAIEHGGTTLQSFFSAEGKPGYFRQHLKAYGRVGQPCPRCKTKFKLIRLGQRATTFCPQCQK